MDYFDKAETWDRATLETVQLARLKTTIQQASRAPFYAKRLAEAGVSADNLRSLEDIRRIPFTSKDDLRSQYPYGLATVPHSEFVRMHCSSGTTGYPGSRLLYPARHQQLGRSHGPLPLHGGRTQGRRVPEHVRATACSRAASASISAPSASAA